MHFIQLIILPLFLATSTVATTWQDVLYDLTRTDGDVKSETTRLNSYTGTGSQLVAIRNGILVLKADLNKATSDQNSAPVTSVANSTTMYRYYGETPLLPDVRILLTAFKNKRQVFRAPGFDPEIASYLKDLRDLTNNLSASLISKAPDQNLKNSFAAARSAYNAAYNDAINYYQS